MNPDIANIRVDYKLKSLSEADVKPDAIDQFGVWWNEAVQSEIYEVNAMTLATAGKNGSGSLRRNRGGAASVTHSRTQVSPQCSRCCSATARSRTGFCS